METRLLYCTLVASVLKPSPTLSGHFHYRVICSFFGQTMQIAFNEFITALFQSMLYSQNNMSRSSKMIKISGFTISTVMASAKVVTGGDRRWPLRYHMSNYHKHCSKFHEYDILPCFLGACNILLNKPFILDAELLLGVVKVVAEHLKKVTP